MTTAIEFVLTIIEIAIDNSRIGRYISDRKKKSRIRKWLRRNK